MFKLNLLLLLLVGLMVLVNASFAQSKSFVAPQSLKAKPFLYLPFDKSDFGKSAKIPLKISEGFIYSEEEKRIHGYDIHFGIDLDAPEGTAVFAPCSGIAQQGFHTSLIRDPKNFDQPILYQSQTIGFGLGHFVQILCDVEDMVTSKKTTVYVMLAHMREVSDRIPKVDFIISKGFEYNPDIYYQFPPEPDPDLKKTKSIKVRRGEYLGRVGRSGLGQFFPNLKGEIDEFETPTKYNPYSWDSSHLHLEVYRRNEKGIKIPTERWDPFGWYGTVDRELRYGKFEQSNNGLFVTGKKQQIKFAKG